MAHEPNDPGRLVTAVIVGRVLLVDDEDDIRFVAEASLTNVGGLDTTVANSGQQALELAGTVNPDVIVLDMMMPGMDGLETLRRLRADPATSRIPVILMTARVQSHELEQYLAAGAIGVISKPFDPMTLHQQIKDMTAPLSADPEED